MTCSNRINVSLLAFLFGLRVTAQTFLLFKIGTQQTVLNAGVCGALVPRTALVGGGGENEQAAQFRPKLIGAVLLSQRKANNSLLAFLQLQQPSKLQAPAS